MTVLLVVAILIYGIGILILASGTAFIVLDEHTSTEEKRYNARLFLASPLWPLLLIWQLGSVVWKIVKFADVGTPRN